MNNDPKHIHNGMHNIDTTKNKKSWLFQGTNEQKMPITIYISAVDRESAIADFEISYPQYRWFSTCECPCII